jgi:hypothetical protein
VTQQGEYDCQCEAPVLEPPPEPRNPSGAAGWMVLVLVIGIALFEAWALRKHRDTISHMIQKLSRGRRWFRWLGVLGMGILTYHLIWGFFW